jgi:hypothetical protein
MLDDSGEDNPPKSLLELFAVRQHHVRMMRSTGSGISNIVVAAHILLQFAVSAVRVAIRRACVARLCATTLFCFCEQVLSFLVHENKV